MLTVKDWEVGNETSDKADTNGSLNMLKKNMG